jgi:hypothetical protein
VQIESGVWVLKKVLNESIDKLFRIYSSIEGRESAVSRSIFYKIIEEEKLFKPLKQNDEPTCQCSVCQQLLAYKEASEKIGVVFQSADELSSLACCDENDLVDEDKNKCMDGECRNCQKVETCKEKLLQRFEHTPNDTIVKFVEYGSTAFGFCGEEKEMSKLEFLGHLAFWLVKGLRQSGAGPKIHTHARMKEQLEECINDLRRAVSQSSEMCMLELDFAMGN